MIKRMICYFLNYYYNDIYTKVYIFNHRPLRAIGLKQSINLK